MRQAWDDDMIDATASAAEMMAAREARKFETRDGTVYLTDNGRAVCGKHLGASAKHTGRDISGQEIMAITPADARLAQREFGYVPSCEQCGRKASA